jgi:hypothetical protein
MAGQSPIAPPAPPPGTPSVPTPPTPTPTTPTAPAPPESAFGTSNKCDASPGSDPSAQYLNEAVEYTATFPYWTGDISSTVQIEAGVYTGYTVEDANANALAAATEQAWNLTLDKSPILLDENRPIEFPGSALWCVDDAYGWLGWLLHDHVFRSIGQNNGDFVTTSWTLGTYVYQFRSVTEADMRGSQWTLVGNVGFNPTGTTQANFEAISWTLGTYVWEFDLIDYASMESTSWTLEYNTDLLEE